MKIPINEIPAYAGIYIMYSKTHQIIYVGKAKNLKKRVTSYFQKKHSDTKTQKLVADIETIKWIITETEIEALVLENNLIKEHMPKYNILLKDQKTYPYVCITKETFPKLFVTRNVKKLKHQKYKIFGPFPGKISSFIEDLCNQFMLRTCNRDLSKLYVRPCLRYQLKNCFAPCIHRDVEKQYSLAIELVEKVLKGGILQRDLKALELKMQESSKQLDFEKAMKYRDRLSVLNRILENQHTEMLRQAKSEDSICFLEERGYLFFCILSVKEGKVMEKFVDYFATEFSDSLDIAKLSAIAYYYQWKLIPSKLVIDKSDTGLAPKIKQYFEKIDAKIEVVVPQISSYRMSLLDIAKKNLKHEIIAFNYKEKRLGERLLDLKERLNLKKIPMHIECFDISNIQGKDAVGSMSVAKNGEITPENYRKYKIQTLDTPNDFGMLKEVMMRRYSKLKTPPDLIVIDGGKGQLSSTASILQSLGILEHVDLISLAKQEEEVFTLIKKESVLLSKDSLALQLLQKLRDEAHRFGITYHRKIRGKRILKSQLDSIPHIGEKRRNALLAHFKTVENIFSADPKELEKIVPKHVVESIKAHDDKGDL